LEHFIFWGSGSKSNGALRFREKGNAKIFAMMVACHQLLSLAGAMAALRVAISNRTRASSVTERQPSTQSCRLPCPATWTPMISTKNTIDRASDAARPLLGNEHEISQSTEVRYRGQARWKLASGRQ
jgi:hypothetical protein